MMDYTDEMLARATAFEEMIRTKGWEIIAGYIQERVKQFANEAIVTGFKSLDEYQHHRGRIEGLREIMIQVESDLEHLKKYREETKRPAKQPE